jgi:hypothetical protein
MSLSRKSATRIDPIADVPRSSCRVKSGKNHSWIISSEHCLDLLGLPPELFEHLHRANEIKDLTDTTLIKRHSANISLTLFRLAARRGLIHEPATPGFGRGFCFPQAISTGYLRIPHMIP